MLLFLPSGRNFNQKVLLLLWFCVRQTAPGFPVGVNQKDRPEKRANPPHFRRGLKLFARCLTKKAKKNPHPKALRLIETFKKIPNHFGPKIRDNCQSSPRTRSMRFAPYLSSNDFPISGAIKNGSLTLSILGLCLSLFIINFFFSFLRPR